MVIRKQPIISWLLEENFIPNPNLITVANTSTLQHVDYLRYSIKCLGENIVNRPDWGLPELLMPSFEKAMQKSAKSFFNIDHLLFQEFSSKNECGILLDKEFGTIVYSFDENKLFVWLFRTVNDTSVLYDYFYFKSTEDNVRHLYCWPSLINDPDLYDTTKEERLKLYECVANLLMTYLAVKKYAKVETIIAPNKTITIVEDTLNEYKQKEKVRNDSGQKVIIMDSRWFVKIINDNDIFVRGFFRLQNKKNELGEWYKELIFVDSYVRHGYHRNAKIEDEENG